MSTPTTHTTLVIGEALVDVVRPLDGGVEEHVGGSPLNVAVGLARLGHPTVLATHLGEDERGRRIRDLLADEEVEVTVSSFDLNSTSTAEATLGADGAASYEFCLDWPPVTGLPQEVAHVHTGSIGASLEPGAPSVLDAMRAAHSRGTTSFDPNVRPTLMSTPERERARVEKFLQSTDVVKSSDEDAEWLYPDHSLEAIARRWAELGPRLVVITRGEKGALVRLGAEATDGSVVELPGRRAEVVDTVGAGDSFTSGLLSGLLDAGLLGDLEARKRLQLAHLEDVRPALERAVLTSSLTVTRTGSNPPRRGDLDQRRS